MKDKRPADKPKIHESADAPLTREEFLRRIRKLSRALPERARLDLRPIQHAARTPYEDLGSRAAEGIREAITNAVERGVRNARREESPPKALSAAVDEGGAGQSTGGAPAGEREARASRKPGTSATALVVFEKGMSRKTADGFFIVNGKSHRVRLTERNLEELRLLVTSKLALELGQKNQKRLKRLSELLGKYGVDTKLEKLGTAYRLHLESILTIHTADGDPDPTAAARRVLRDAQRDRFRGQG